MFPLIVNVGLIVVTAGLTIYPKRPDNRHFCH